MGRKIKTTNLIAQILVPLSLISAIVFRLQVTYLSIGDPKLFARLRSRALWNGGDVITVQWKDGRFWISKPIDEGTNVRFGSKADIRRYFVERPLLGVKQTLVRG